MTAVVELIDKLKAIADAILDDIAEHRKDNTSAGDDNERAAFLRGELAGIQQAIDIASKQ